MSEDFDLLFLLSLDDLAAGIVESDELGDLCAPVELGEGGLEFAGVDDEIVYTSNLSQTLASPESRSAYKREAAWSVGFTPIFERAIQNFDRKLQ